MHMRGEFYRSDVVECEEIAAKCRWKLIVLCQHSHFCRRFQVYGFKSIAPNFSCGFWRSLLMPLWCGDVAACKLV